MYSMMFPPPAFPSRAVGPTPGGASNPLGAVKKCRSPGPAPDSGVGRLVVVARSLYCGGVAFYFF